MLTDQFLPITPASPLLTGRFVTSRNTCSSWLGNKFGCLFRNSFVRQYLLVTFQSTSVKVLFSTIWWGLPNGRLTALRHFWFFFEKCCGYQYAQNFGILQLSLSTWCYQIHCMCMIAQYFV